MRLSIQYNTIQWVGKGIRNERWIISTTKQAIRIIKLVTTVDHFFTWPWLWKRLYGLISLCIVVVVVVVVVVFLSAMWACKFLHVIHSFIHSNSSNSSSTSSCSSGILLTPFSTWRWWQWWCWWWSLLLLWWWWKWWWWWFVFYHQIILTISITRMVIIVILLSWLKYWRQALAVPWFPTLHVRSVAHSSSSEHSDPAVFSVVTKQQTHDNLCRWRDKHTKSCVSVSRKIVFVCLLKAYSPANRIWSPQGFYKTCTLL